MLDLFKNHKLRPAPGVEALVAYAVPRPSAPIDLHLDGNEGMAPPAALLEAAASLDIEKVVRRYPKPASLEGLLAARLGVSPAQVLVTAGADEALDRACRAMLTPQRTAVMPSPTFVMLPKYAAMAGAQVEAVPWPDGPFPTEQTLSVLHDEVGIIAVVSPNNPTGAVATAEDLRRLSRAAPWAMLMVDLAYTEFADEDLTAAALQLPNAVVFRTLSKSWGLAGLRVGYAVGQPEVIALLRACGSPYSVSGLSLALAALHLERHGARAAAFVARIRQERQALITTLATLGARPLPSQGNFVYCRPRGGSVALRDGLAAHGIGVRAWPGDPVLGDGVRITCPGDGDDFQRLTDALQEVLG